MGVSENIGVIAFAIIGLLVVSVVGQLMKSLVRIRKK